MVGSILKYTCIYFRLFFHHVKTCCYSEYHHAGILFSLTTQFIVVINPQLLANTSRLQHNSQTNSKRVYS